MELIEYVDADMMMISLAGALSRDLRAALARRQRVLFCVPAGGDVAEEVFELLAAVDLEWDRVDVLPTDEVWMPGHDARSTARRVRARLLQNRAAAARLIDLWRPGAAPEAVVDDLAAEVAALLPVDVALVVPGADGRVAALAAGTPGLELALADDAPELVALHPPGAPAAHLCVSARVLRRAFVLHVAVTGDAGRSLIERARGGDPLEMPVAALLDPATVHWAE